MNKILITLLGAAALAIPAALGQQPTRQAVAVVEQANSALHEQNLTKFDLDFPGGTPRQLVEAIEKSSGRPLNAIIPDEDASVVLPPLKLKNVNVSQLFDGLSAASQKVVPFATAFNMTGPDGIIRPRHAIETYTESYGFRTSGPLTDDSIWYFYYNRNRPDSQMLTPNLCRYYQLAPYLDTYKVEDITTAIQTGWKMLGETNPPTISFHKDTKLLIAVGEESKLQLIDSVLQQLGTGKPQPKPVAAAKSGEAKKQ